MLAVVVVEGIAILLLGLLVVGLLRSHAEILRSLHDLGAGVDVADPQPPRLQPQPIEIGARTASDVSGTAVDGSAAAVGIVGADHATLLAFLSTTCLTCMSFWETFATAYELPGSTRLVIVVQDEDSDKRLRKLAPASVATVKSTAAWQAYDVPGSPHFVLVEGRGGRILGEGTGNTWDQVLDLLEQASAGLLLPGGDDRDNPTRIDAELAAAGIGAGHPSLYRSLDADGGLADPGSADVGPRDRSNANGGRLR